MNKQGLVLGYVVLALIVIFAVSCRGSKNIKKHPTSKIEQTDASTIYPLIISFYSSGGGIDRQMKKDFESYITETHKNLVFEKISWGREGELDYCFSLKGLDKDKSAQFIADTKDFLSKSTKVHIIENEACKHKRAN